MNRRSTRHVTRIAATLAVAAISCARHAPQRHTIEMTNFAYHPAALTVAEGDTIVWKNTDFAPHTSTARDSTWDSKSVDPDSTFTYVARGRGRHDYYCALHPSMAGSIDVR